MPAFETVNGEELLVFDRGWDIIYMPWADPGEELKDELASYVYNYRSEVHFGNKGSLSDQKYRKIFIFGHGNYHAIIGAQAKQSYSAKGLAKHLVDSGLPKSMPNGGSIVLWTCWGGVPGGLAYTLRHELQSHFTTNTEVWGSRFATGNLIDRYLDVIPGVQFRVQEDSNELPFGTGMTTYTSAVSQAGIINGNRYPAKKSDLKCYS